MTTKSYQKSNDLAKSRKLVFSGILVLFPVILLVLLELVLRMGGYGYDLKLFHHSENYPGYYEINQDVNFRYFSKVGKTSPTNDIFLEEKPDTCFRVFVLGGSTTRGFPYQAGTSFPRILHYRLHDAFPEHLIEVVNLSASAINSYSFIDMIDEVLRHDPDLVLLYGGHNEYYGALGVGSVENGGNRRWIKKIRLKLVRARTFQLVQNVIAKVASLAAKHENEASTLMSRIVADKDIELGSELYEKGVRQFETNLQEVIEKCQHRNVPILLSELVSNVEDQPPFKSADTQEGESAIEHYRKAMQLAKKGKYNEARELYYRAKDLDVVRFRAPEAFNNILRNMAAEEGVGLVPMQHYFESASPNGLIGHELMLEHLHPTIDGYFLMADAFFNSILEKQYLTSPVNENDLKPASYYRYNWGFSALDSLIGDLNIQSLKSGWPFTMSGKPNAFLETYVYKSKVDSMAYHYLIKQNRHIEDEHLKLANYYRANGDYQNAFEEYYSMVKLHPYIPDMTYDAVLMLIELKNYTKAKAILEDAFFGKESYRYNYYMGTLTLKTGKASDAVPYLETAYRLKNSNENNLALLQPLFLAYRANGETENAEKIIDEIRAINAELAASLAVVQKPVADLTTLINKAATLAQQQEYRAAIALLKDSPEFENEYLVNKMLGATYMMTKEFPLSFKYCIATYKLNSKDADNIYNLFVLYLMQNKLNMAQRMLTELKALNYSEEKLERLNVMYENKRKTLQKE